jgi:Flp pilus assembly pilin Flp
MLGLYVWLIGRVDELIGERRETGEIGIEYVILVAVIGAAVLAGATVFKGAVTAAFNKIATMVNGI